jgi:phage gpG-like protein
MSTEIVQVEQQRVVVALGRFRLGIQHNDELMRLIGAAQLVSVRRTFREQGSPAGSWAPLSPNTIRSNPKLYGAGHKLLIQKGTLLNSITFATFTGGVRIGTNLVYARVQQEGSADRRGAAIGPQAKIEGRSVKVGRYKRLRAIHYGTRELEGKDGTTYRVPVAAKSGKHKIIDKSGRETTVSAKYQGPLNKDVQVGEHERHQNIPPRPYLIIRPEDPKRIRGIVVGYVNRQRAAAGLKAGGAL